MFRDKIRVSMKTVMTENFNLFIGLPKYYIQATFTFYGRRES